MKSATERFNIETRLAVGCAGLVYRAVERQTNFPVALKLLLGEEIGHPLDAAALQRDAPRLRTISGAHVAQLLDVLEDADGTILAYQFLDGESGATLPQTRHIEAAEAIDLAAQMLTALECAERTRLPHGDWKPSNVVVSQMDDGRPFLLVLDWGLSAYRAEPTPDSLLFLAPERWSGGTPSVRADFFSAGAVLHYLLAGQALIAGGTREEIGVQWRAADPLALKNQRPDLPAKFVDWIAWLLELRPEKRPASVAEARQALAVFQPPPPPAVPRHLIARPVMMRPQPSSITKVPAPKPSGVWTLPPGVSMPHANLPERVTPVPAPEPLPAETPEHSPAPEEMVADEILPEEIAAEEVEPALESEAESPENQVEAIPEIVPKTRRRFHPALAGALAVLLGAVTAGGVWFFKKNGGEKMAPKAAPAPENLSDGTKTGWLDLDMGKPAQKGNADFNNKTGIWMVRGAGTSLGENGQLHFVGMKFSGDAMVVARITKMENTHTLAKAGVIFRDSEAPDAMFACVMVTPSAKAIFHWRDKPGGVVGNSKEEHLPIPGWLRIARGKNSFTGWVSRDGEHWNRLEKPREIPMAAATFAGLAVSSHNPAVLNSTAFSNLSILPPDWHDTDIGTPSLAGGALYDPSAKTWTVRGSGADIWENSDQFHFVWRGKTRELSMRTRLLKLEKTGEWAKAGVMFRAGLDPKAACAALVATPGQGVIFQWRSVAGGVSEKVRLPRVVPPVSLELTRAGDLVTARISADGKTWKPLGVPKKIELPPDAYLGYCVSAFAKDKVTTATFAP